MRKLVSKFSAPTVKAPPVDETINMLAPNLMPFDSLLARNVARALKRYYPDWHWRVEIPAPVLGRARDDLIIRNLDCDPRGKMGFYLRKSSISGGNLDQVVMRAGGEFLERYKMRRSGFRMEEIADRRMIFERPQT